MTTKLGIYYSVKSVEKSTKSSVLFLSIFGNYYWLVDFCVNSRRALFVSKPCPFKRFFQLYDFFFLSVL